MCVTCISYKLLTFLLNIQYSDENLVPAAVKLATVITEELEAKKLFDI